MYDKVIIPCNCLCHYHVYVFPASNPVMDFHGRRSLDVEGDTLGCVVTGILFTKCDHGDKMKDGKKSERTNQDISAARGVQVSSKR